MDYMIDDEWIESYLNDRPSLYWYSRGAVRTAMRELRDLYEVERRSEIVALRTEIACLRKALNDLRSGVTVYHGPQPQPGEREPDWDKAPPWANWWAVDSHGMAMWSDTEPPYMVNGKWHYPPGCRVFTELQPYYNWLPYKRQRPQEVQ